MRALGQSAWLESMQGQFRDVKNIDAHNIDAHNIDVHNGSAFGRTLEPSQINFENAIAVRLLELRHQNNDKSNVAPLVVEDEGRTLGSLNISYIFHGKMLQSPIVVIDSDYPRKFSPFLDTATT